MTAYVGLLLIRSIDESTERGGGGRSRQIKFSLYTSLIPDHMFFSNILHYSFVLFIDVYLVNSTGHLIIRSEVGYASKCGRSVAGV